jgi:SOS response regulatory protein OraA/RecX
VTAPDPSKRIFQKAGALLAYRARSRGELREKLASLGEAPQIEAVLDRLEKLELLNDAEYAYNSASRWIRQEGWGPAKVRARLIQRRVAVVRVEGALERVRREIAETDAITGYLERLFRTRALPGNRKGIHKLFMSLQRRGFSSEAIQQVLRRKIGPEAWQDFDTGD